MATPLPISDLVVLLPGIMGSTLVKNGSLVWGPSAGFVLKAIATFGGSIGEMTLRKDLGDEDPKDGVEPRAIMPDLHVLPGIWSANIGYEKLFDWLRTRFELVAPSAADPSRFPNLLPVPYDWRLSNRFNGRRLKRIVEPALDNWRAQGGSFAYARIIFICHSMGGLVARWYIEKEGGAKYTRKLLTMGTPYRGAMSALDQLVNGVRIGKGPLKLDLTTFGRSLPSLHQLLPEYACIESSGGLAKTTEVDLPRLDPTMVADAMKFHEELDAAALANSEHPYDVHPIVGFRQPTLTTAAIVDGAVRAAETIAGKDETGDATVPRLSATPKSLRPNSPGIRWIPDQHGSLQSNDALIDEIEGVLTSEPVIHKAAFQHELGVRIEPFVLAGEAVHVDATVSGEKRVALAARVIDERGNEVTTVGLRGSGGRYHASIGPLVPGGYHVVVGATGSMSTAVAPVTCTMLVWV